MEGSTPPIRLTVPAGLAYRGVVIRVAASACRLAADGEGRAGRVDHSADLSARFDAELVSAVSEIFNNVVIHGHDGGDARARVTVSIDVRDRCVGVRIRDGGRRFDARAVPDPDLGALPEGGLGLHIARSFLDRIEYRPGPPNVWHLTKCAGRQGGAGAGGGSAAGARGGPDETDAETDDCDDIFED